MVIPFQTDLLIRPGIFPVLHHYACVAPSVLKASLMPCFRFSSIRDSAVTPKLYAEKLHFQKKPVTTVFPILASPFRTLSLCHVLESIPPCLKWSGPRGHEKRNYMAALLSACSQAHRCSVFNACRVSVPACLPRQPKPLPLRKHPASTGKQGRLAHHIAWSPCCSWVEQRCRSPTKPAQTADPEAKDHFTDTKLNQTE